MRVKTKLFVFFSLKKAPLVIGSFYHRILFTGNMKKTRFFCPLFHQENIWDELNLKTLNVDHVGLFRPLEMILNPGEVLLTSVQSKHVAKVSCPRLYGTQPFFALRRLLGSSQVSFDDLHKPSSDETLKRMLDQEGKPYVWGGNRVLTNEEFSYVNDLYFDQSSEFLSHLKFLFSGLDCSGLLYFATDGLTPRNTSELVSYGEGIDISGMSNSQILDKVRPLDLLVWRGHVLIFLNKKEMIESRLNHGVIRVDAASRLDEIRQTRQPAYLANEQTFVLRRWACS
jgi:NlpC/P60 family